MLNSCSRQQRRLSAHESGASMSDSLSMFIDNA